RNSGTVMGTSTPTFAAIIFKIGKKSAVPSGTEHPRVTVADMPRIPVKNHAGPRCPTVHFSPVSSNWGLADAGIERTHCHHSALHSPYPLPKGRDAGAKTRGSRTLGL